MVKKKITNIKKMVYYSKVNKITIYEINILNGDSLDKESLANRLYYLSDLIPLSWLNLSLDSFKVNCKKLFFKM